MALAFGMAVLVLGDIQNEAGNGANRGVRARAVAGAILILLVAGFPTPSQFETGLPAMLGQDDEPGHPMLLDMTVQGESGFGEEQARDYAEDQGFGRSGGCI